ncbi:MAG: D-alanyl-D-alanine carboxypeptidase/D-alanyl-D-alanine-endopeptidase [Balneolales bacterium]|nr:D-alanyl-D-alanine carboxypeptidase/D-alanyl-D-alanine-endopeptidase [Balneolales bacterium]
MLQTIRTVLLILFVSVANALSAQDLLSIIDSAPNKEAFWSVSIRDTDGNIIEEYNSDKLIIPASNQKLFTTAAILDGLKSEYRYHTKIFGLGNLVDSTWNGDLIILGVGDPSISGFMYEEDRDFVFRSFTDQLKSKGINKISGQLIASVSYFDFRMYPKGWDWEDLSFYYGVEIAPLSFNNNAVDLVVDASVSQNEKPELSWYPGNTSFVEFINEQNVVAPNREYDEDYLKFPGENVFYLGSDLPEGYLEEESFAITGAADYFLTALDMYLNDHGIETSLAFKVDNTHNPDYWETYPVLASHTSEPISKLVEWTNKESDNFYTEMMLKTLSAEKQGIPGTFENGIKEVRNFLGRMEIDTMYVIMKDGSGMASGNFTKTSILSEFLVKMQHHSGFDTFYNSMSIAGIDGTIAHRMKGTQLYNNFKGKSGFVGGVRTLSGYFTTASGERLIVSLAANNFIGKVRPIDAVHEQILAYLYAKY